MQHTIQYAFPAHLTLRPWHLMYVSVCSIQQSLRGESQGEDYSNGGLFFLHRPCICLLGLVVLDMLFPAFDALGVKSHKHRSVL